MTGADLTAGTVAAEVAYRVGVGFRCGPAL